MTFLGTFGVEDWCSIVMVLEMELDVFMSGS
jgi:hypothetical protein